MFTSWVFDQKDRDDRTGQLAKLVWSDYNSGCARAYRDAVGWKEHFERKHPRHYSELLDLLGDAFVEYVNELDKQAEMF
jgi:hypothetical protein